MLVLKMYLYNKRFENSKIILCKFIFDKGTIAS